MDAFVRELDDRRAGWQRSGEADEEQLLDTLRRAHHAEVFRTLVRDVEGLITVEQVADDLSALADAVLAIVLRWAWARFAKRHREEGALAVIAYGKLGGKELGYSSDLDIVFLYDDDHPDAQENYTRLAQRTNTWLSSQTAAGILFETDLRLRPNGDAGLLANSVESFREYELKNAWVWEHQALTRARFAAGDAATGAEFERIRNEIIARPRDWPKLRADVIEMRARVAEGHPNRKAGELFDLKHDNGGLVDMEFAVQALVLRYGAVQPTMRADHGNIALAIRAGELGLVTAEAGLAAANAYRALRSRQHAIRLQGAERAAKEQASNAAQGK